MATPVDRASSAARLGQQNLAGRSLILRRYVNGVAVLGLAQRATIGETRAEEYLEGGAVVITRYRDYFIDVDDYVIGGEPTSPQIDDQIVETIDGEQLTFQVLPAGGGPVTRFSDRAQRIWRVHTRQIRD